LGLISSQLLSAKDEYRGEGFTLVHSSTAEQDSGQIGAGMNEGDRIQVWLTETVRLMVDRPDDVIVHKAEGGVMTLRVCVHSTDVGKIIGKQGRTARSLRTISSAIAMAHGARVALDIVEG
jgi:uncharacterized protein